MHEDAILAALKSLQEDVTRVVHAVEGNGQPGLKLRVDRLEQARARDTEEANERREPRTALQIALITALVNAGLLGVYMFIKQFA